MQRPKKYHKSVLNVTLDRETSHKGQCFEIEIYISNSKFQNQNFKVVP